MSEMSKKEFLDLLLQQMAIFAKQNLNNYKRVDEDATGNRYVDYLMLDINEEFTKQFRIYLSLSMTNEENKSLKKDLKLWQTPSMHRINSVYRFNNQVPLNVEKAAHGRNYDRSNEGIRGNSKDCILRHVPKNFKTINGDFWEKSSHWF